MRGLKGSKVECSVEGCLVLAVARGWCYKHWGAWKRTGDPNTPLRPRVGQRSREDCSVEGCSKGFYAHELCKRHYYINKRHGDPLAQPKQVSSVARYNQDGLRVCANCREYKQLDQYSASKSRTDGFHPYCHECRKIRRLADRFGLSIETYTEMLEEQNNLCLICMEVEPEVVDHDHACCSGASKKTCGKCVRGLLCFQCNIFLGKVEKPGILERIIEYLDGGKSE